MASMSSAFGPKLRSRKHGAAIPLDERDKRLLNLMQGSFPIAPRPYQHVAAQAEMREEEAIARVAELIEHRIIRQVTPIFDTRALGYSSMLVAAKVDPENPWRAAKVINEHPGVSHNYLRNHEFNIWFTIATEPDSPLGLDRTLEVLGEIAGAESIRQLPTLKLFKIRMDLEMEGGTDALAKTVEVAPPAETERQPYDERDIAVIKALQGDMPIVSEPYASAAEQLGMAQEELLAHLEQMQERRLLRRVAAILFHRRAGFSANGMGVWKVPDDRVMELGPRMAAFRGISHCYQRPTYKDWPYSIFTMAHGRSKDECDAILESIADLTGICDRATLYSSTEFKKIRLLYFTEDYRDWERKHAGV
jgi:DNA-binding Lrp family transcriptional regulator